MNSCLYECEMMHARLAPQQHRFGYRIFMFAIDLDELPLLQRTLVPFSINRANLYSFREQDYMPTPPTAGRLKDRVTTFLSKDGVDVSGGRVLLVTLPRVAGYLFNPVSFYFCFDRAGIPVAAIAEVTNTFKEMKPYVIRAVDSHEAPGRFRLRVPKFFYVSPFSDVDVEFDFNLTCPTERLSVQIDDYTAGRRTFISSLTGARRSLTTARLLWFTVAYPLITLRIIALIHWHAFRLWLKNVPWFPKAARAADQRQLCRPHISLRRSSPVSAAVSIDPLP